LEITDVTNERKLINEDLAFHFERDVTKYPDTVLNTVLDKKELYAQAQCVLFATKVTEPYLGWKSTTHYFHRVYSVVPSKVLFNARISANFSVTASLTFVANNTH